MSLHFIIDGYNLIKQTGILNKPNLEDSRSALIKLLKIHRPQGSSNNRVTIVFDGKKDHYYPGQISENVYPDSGMKVIFSQDESADDKIRQLVRDSKNPRNIVVVTNDREIQIFVRQLKAQVRAVEEFLLKFNRGSPGISSRAEDKIILPPPDAAKITEEMKDVWLR